MNIVLKIAVKISEEGLAAYYAEYPGFQGEYHETPAATLMREAITAWDSEGLLEEPWDEEPKWEILEES